jgi:mRNA interferase RelE/StbE
MYNIQLTKKAEKVYSKANSSLLNKLNRCFEQLENNPYNHPNIKPLQGKLLGKLHYRICDWRVIYSVNEEGKIVIILIISPRIEAYER